MKRLWLFIPLALLLALLGVIFVVYHTLDYEADSPMVGQKVPSLILQALDDGEMDLADHTGQPYLLHIGASWCESCRMEHTELLDIAGWHFPMVGVFYKDTPEDVKTFLSEHNNPYELTFLDQDGRSLVNLGGMALPTSYLVDADGVIQAVFSGPIHSSSQVIEQVWGPHLSE